MTVASEITRLQQAKADAKTSIENKGVSVPANATIDTYHNYIDQITTGDPRGKYVVHTLLRTTYVAQLWSGDRVSFIWQEMSYVDDDVMILCRPRKYDDYSSTWFSTQTVNLQAWLLDWTSMDFTIGRWGTGGYLDDAVITALSYKCYREWNVIYFKLNYRVSRGWDAYYVDTLSYNVSTSTWWTDHEGVGSSYRLDNTGDMNLYTASWEWATSWSWARPLIVFTPVFSS